MYVFLDSICEFILLMKHFFPHSSVSIVVNPNDIRRVEIILQS